MVNLRRETQVECLQDVPNHVREIALHGVYAGAAGALAAAQLHDGARLSKTLALDFIEECNDETSTI